MAFYPDELSPIEKLRSPGKAEPCDSNLAAINRRQWWKSLGRKDLGANNFATIAEEKEEDISSDEGDDGPRADLPIGNSLVPKKKIIFPKPRKYVTPTPADRKEDLLFDVADLQGKEMSSEKKPIDRLETANGPKMNPAEAKQWSSTVIKGKKFADDEIARQKQEIVSGYAVSEINPEKRWKEIAANPPMLTGWPKPEGGKAKGKDEKKKTKTAGKKLEQKKPRQESEAKASGAVAASDGKGKSLNMKDVVNVYKNLTYGTKDEIKSFVEKLSFVKDEEKDKNLLSMMNLKALETKIKDLEKKKGQSATQGKKRGKSGKRMRKNHIENLARHKVVKVPATLEYSYSPESRNASQASGASSEQQRKSNGDKAPWKYVGTQSVLDKMYFVYPSYPQPQRKKTVKKSDSETKRQGKEVVEEAPTKNQSKVKQGKKVLVSQNSGIRREASRSANPLELSASPSAKRSSATTICTVEFRPEAERKAGSSGQSLLFYLHDAKATHVRSPYSDKQFSRVNFFRKNGARSPLVRGIELRDIERSVTVRNIRMPVSFSSCRLEDLFDFEDDIQNINEFLRSQNRVGRSRRGKRMREPSQKKSLNARIANERKSHKLLTESIADDIEGLQYLSDTEENRQIIEHFFDELDERIESSKTGHFSDAADTTDNNKNCLIPIVGY